MCFCYKHICLSTAVTEFVRCYDIPLVMSWDKTGAAVCVHVLLFKHSFSFSEIHFYLLRNALFYLLKNPLLCVFSKPLFNLPRKPHSSILKWAHPTDLEKLHSSDKGCQTRKKNKNYEQTTEHQDNKCLLILGFQISMVRHTPVFVSSEKKVWP